MAQIVAIRQLTPHCLFQTYGSKAVSFTPDSGGHPQERRINKSDRRLRAEKLPCHDGNDNYVVFERRYFPDRRVSHYNPDWSVGHP